MKKIFIAFFFVFSVINAGFAQGEIDEQSKIFYRNEISGGIILNTSGFGIGYRYGKRVNYRDKWLYELDLSFYKDMKEIKMTNPIFPNNRGFVFGKMNSFFHLSAGYGFQHEVFRKFDVGGIAIRYYGTAGPSLGFVKPIYYEILHPINPYYEYIVEIEKFDMSMHSSDQIYGKASMFRGLDETKLLPGVFFKAGVNFEYSKYDEFLHAIDVGVMLHAFVNKVPVMAGKDHSFLFPSLFVSYRFGKIVDPRAPRTREKPRRRIEMPPDIEYY